MPTQDLINLRRKTPCNAWNRLEKRIRTGDFNFFCFCQPDQTITKLGGEGLSFLFFQREKPGSALLFRLWTACASYRKIWKKSDHQSQVPGKRPFLWPRWTYGDYLWIRERKIGSKPTWIGRVVFTFSNLPEETGRTAQSNLARSQVWRNSTGLLHSPCIICQAIHYTKSLMRQGTLLQAGTGMSISLKAKRLMRPSEAGINPAQALADLIQKLPELQKKRSRRISLYG